MKKALKWIGIVLAALCVLCLVLPAENTDTIPDVSAPQEIVTTTSRTENSPSADATVANTKQTTTTTKPTTTTTTAKLTTTTITTAKPTTTTIESTTTTTTTQKPTTTTTITTTAKKTTTTTKKPTTSKVTEAVETEDDEMRVWIPESGTKYHTHSGCSNMKNPRKVTLEEAKSLGFTACKRCH